MSEEKRTQLADTERDTEAEKSRTQRDRLLVAVHRLEACLGSAAPGREAQWIAKVNEALALLQAAMQWRFTAGDGLLEDIEVTAPHLWPGMERLREEYENLERQVGMLLAEFSSAVAVDYRDARQRIGSLLTTLRHQQSREIDLIFEVYNRDIGVGD